MDWKKRIEETLAHAKTADKGWNDRGWTQLDSFVGDQGTCAIWVNNQYPTHYAVTANYPTGERKDLLCMGRKHAIHIYIHTRDCCGLATA